MDSLSCEFTVETKGICYLAGQKGGRLCPLAMLFTSLEKECFLLPKCPADDANEWNSNRLHRLHKLCLLIPAENLTQHFMS